MTRFQFAVFTFLFVIAGSAAAFSQTSPAPKVGYINSDAFFDEKVGITKVVAANKQLDTEFGARLKDLQSKGTRIQAIGKELEAIQKAPTPNPALFRTKQEEGQSLERQYNYDKTELESAVSKRRAQLFEPINKDIGRGIDEFAKKNGYGLILDMAKLIESGSVLYFAELADATKDFIAFYNARPATATASATPR